MRMLANPPVCGAGPIATTSVLGSLAAGAVCAAPRPTRPRPAVAAINAANVETKRIEVARLGFECMGPPCSTNDEYSNATGGREWPPAAAVLYIIVAMCPGLS